jgi:ABC-2 type transport system permease protein
MFSEFKHTLRRLRGQIIGWGIGLAIYGILMVSLFDSIVGIEGFQELISSYPPEIMAFFGDMIEIVTPVGYLDIYYFTYMTFIIGIFAASAGASLVVADEEKGILDLVMAHPISRTSLFLGRILGFMAATALILLIGWLSWAVPSGGTSLDLTWIEFLRPFLPLYGILLLFGVFATVLSMFLPSSRSAGAISGGLLVANFLLMGLSNINEDLKTIVKYTPLNYYQGGDAVKRLNWEWLGGLLVVSALFALIAWWRFQQRDIRVGGEGGWRLPLARRFARRKLGRNVKQPA